ncbi:photosynthetic complex assembly protein PuhC [Congregibacter litoralis]|uniref:Putative photosynthetic complex assembly protein n=1 Tax=Congregibacter litoralis KT71 TaxID=314285 RepID=A4ACQ0_9GAMM|nr:photosynthetic complex assembly protein PuhC [Congregibacter litoralis]EAQ96264.2 putative photosynthetic complex assembly protein [Congregibacter litoralis KT71]
MTEAMTPEQRVTRTNTMDSGSRILLAGLAVFVMAVLAATLIARLTGYSMDSAPESAVIETRELGFRDLPDGAVEVFEWHSKSSLATIPSGEGAFLRGVVRSLVRQRRGLDSGIASMFELKRYDDGRLVLADPVTAESIDLVAFGSTNIAVFAALMDAPLDSSADSVDNW